MSILAKIYVMKKIILPALILALISFTSYLFKNPETMQIPPIINWSFVLLTFIVLLWAVRRYKSVHSNGSISFAKAFNYGFKITLGYALISSIGYFIFIKINADSVSKFTETVIKNAHEKSLETQGTVSASQEKRFNNVFAYMNNPYILSGLAIISSLFSGTIYSLIAAAIVKNKTENIIE